MISSPTHRRELSPDPRRLEPLELTPVHQRTSRRLRGDSPEFGPLLFAAREPTDRATMTSQVTTPAQLIVSQPITPQAFHGDSFEDAEDWLDHFERVARSNEWSEERKLRHVYFALEDSARTWFENHEASLSSWEEFRQQLLATYGSNDRREKAETALRARNQRTNESVAMYIEDMSRLFKRADPNMSEDKKVRHLMHGVKQELFAGLVRNPPRTVAEFRSEATTIEMTLQQRARQYNRDLSCASANVFSACTDNNLHTLRELVRSVVREELRKMQSHEVPPEPSIVDIVRSEVRQAIREPQCEPAPARPTPTYSEMLRRPAVHSAPIVESAPIVHSASIVHSAPIARPSNYVPIAHNAPRMAETRPRKSDVWRDANRRPLCFHCGEAGHLYRFCPYRQAGLRGFSMNAPCPRNGERPSDIEEYLCTRQSFSAPRHHESRSPYPMRYRSPSPRASSSTTRHRSPSPKPEN